MKVARSFALWCVALVVVGAFAFALHPHSSSTQSRIVHLESLVRCPACDDISVAVSNATSAVAVRHEIVAKVRAGKSDDQILTSLESVYGTSILLAPPTSGIGALLWIVPVLIVLLLIASAIRLARRR
ncbi:MAG TPA: cytochrome c-type biogenesis protein [Acidimicrobiales bacterium]